jgi:hypothetical protein
MSRDGSVGTATFEQVEALLKKGKNKKAAFDQIATDTGKNSGTVAANYYRAARANGAVKPRRRPRAVAPRSRASVKAGAANGARQGRAQTNGSIDKITKDLVRNVQALATAVTVQENEVADLRARLDGVRNLLG